MAEPLAIVTQETLPVAQAGQAYAYQMQAVGGTAPYVWALSAGAFPLGMSVNAAGLVAAVGGALSEGDSGTYTVTLEVTDAVLATDTVVLVLLLEPFNIRRTQLFQLDQRLTELVQLFYGRGITPEEITRHFYRVLDGVIPGANLAHEDIDILVRAWAALGGADVTLRDALDSIITGGLGTVVTLVTPGASVTGVPDIIAIGAAPTSAGTTQLTVNGVTQLFGLDYTITGTDLNYLNAAGRYTLSPTDELVLRYV